MAAFSGEPETGEAEDDGCASRHGNSRRPRDAEMTTNPTVGEQRRDDMRRQGGRFNPPARLQESHPRFDAMKVRSRRVVC
jgi:hypothetical protein